MRKKKDKGVEEAEEGREAEKEEEEERKVNGPKLSPSWKRVAS